MEDVILFVLAVAGGIGLAICFGGAVYCGWQALEEGLKILRNPD